MHDLITAAAKERLLVKKRGKKKRTSPEDGKARLIHEQLTNTRMASLECEDCHLSDMLDIIRTTLHNKGITINIIPLFEEPGSEQHKQFMSKKLTFKLDDISIEELLVLLSRQIGIDYEVSSYGITISPAKESRSR